MTSPGSPATPATPRLAPLPVEEMTEDQRALVNATGSGRPLNIFATLVRAPGLYRRWAPFGGKLLQGGKVPARDREIVILRTAFRCGSAYEWGQHVSIGRTAGLSDDEILRVAKGPDAAGWNELDATLVRMVDELNDTHVLTDATWATLAGAYTEEQLIEVIMLSGHYALLANVLNSCGVPVDGELPGLGQV